MARPLVVEFVAGPRCGETETLADCGSLRPPLSIALPIVREGGTQATTYVRRDDHPDPRTSRWLFDHAPGSA